MLRDTAHSDIFITDRGLGNGVHCIENQTLILLKGVLTNSTGTTAHDTGYQ